MTKKQDASRWLTRQIKLIKISETHVRTKRTYFLENNKVSSNVQ